MLGRQPMVARRAGDAMADVLTYLVVKVPGSSTSGAGSRRRLTTEDVVDALTAAGGAVVRQAVHDRHDPTVVAATFVLASDALRAALAVRRPAATAGAAGADRDVPFRAAVCTGVADAGEAVSAEAMWACAHDLVAAAAPGEVLVAASTAVVVGNALPPRTNLVDRGTSQLPGLGEVRTYALRSLPETDGGIGASNLAWARRAAPGPLVGRSEELSALDAAWAAALRGRQRLLIASGEAGIGKTTLAAALALRVHAGGGLVLYGRWDQNRVAPYQAVSEALSAYGDTCPTECLRADLAGCLDGVARLLPEVAARVGGVRPSLSPDPERDRLLVFDGIEGWLDRIAVRRPVLLVLDDLQWADSDSLLLVDHLRCATVARPLLILATEREGERIYGSVSALAASEDGMDDGVQPVRVPLAGLDVGSVNRLVEQALRGPVDMGDPELGDAIRGLARDTAGNPLFVQEVLRALPGGMGGAARLRAARRAAPERLGDLVRWRLAQLPATTADVLSVASIVGREVGLDMLAEATGMPPVAIEGPVDDAVRAGLLRFDGRGERVAFVHDVLYESLREGVGPEPATLVHRRVAAALTARAATDGSVRSDEVAHHWLRGVDTATVPAAVRWARRGAQAATRAAAFETALDLLLRAVEAHDRHALGDVDDAVLGCELRLELAQAQDRARRFAARDRTVLEAADIARGLGRSDLLVRAALGLGGGAPAASPSVPAACDLLDEAIARTGDDNRTRALLLARRTHVRQGELPRRERRAGVDRALALARGAEDPAVLAAVLVSRGSVLDGPDDVPEQLATGEEIQAIGERIGDRELVLRGNCLRIPALLALGQGAEARRLTTAFARLADELYHPAHLAIAAMLDVLWAVLDGEYDRGEAVAELLRTQLADAGHPDGAMIHAGQAFALRWLRGGLDTVRPELERLRSAAPEAPVWWAAMASLDVSTGNEGSALAHLAAMDAEAVIGALDKNYMWWPTITSCANAAAAGDRAWAAVLHETLAPYAGRTCVFGYSVFAGAVEHYRGTLALALDRRNQAVAQLGDGMDQHEALGATPFVALSARWLARALVRRSKPGDDRLSASLARRSAELAADLGLHGLPQFPEVREASAAGGDPSGLTVT